MRYERFILLCDDNCSPMEDVILRRCVVILILEIAKHLQCHTNKEQHFHLLQHPITVKTTKAATEHLLIAGVIASPFSRMFRHHIPMCNSSLNPLSAFA